MSAAASDDLLECQLSTPPRQQAQLVASASTLTSCILATCGFTSTSPAILWFAVEQCVGAASSAFVMWRFCQPGERREPCASLGVAICLVLLALVVSGGAVAFLAAPQKVDDVSMLVGLSVPSLVIFGLLGGLKRQIATPSATLISDGTLSIAQALIAVASLVGAGTVHEQKHRTKPLGLRDNHGHSLSTNEAWWLDAALSLTISLSLLIYGGHAMLTTVDGRGERPWNPGFWRARNVRVEHSTTLSGTVELERAI